VSGEWIDFTTLTQIPKRYLNETFELGVNLLMTNDGDIPYFIELSLRNVCCFLCQLKVCVELII